jgi:hypothetical protein
MLKIYDFIKMKKKKTLGISTIPDKKIKLILVNLFIQINFSQFI